MKQNIEFYPHYATSDQHAKFKMLRVQFGWEGEGKFWALNNRIALSEGCCLDISKKYNKAALASDLNFTLNKFDEFVNFLKNDCELIKTCGNGAITTDIIQETFGKVMQERDKARERHRRTSGEKTKTSGEKIHIVKESKGKENKGNKNKRKFNEKEFLIFYSAYPNPKSKKAALEKWKKLIKSGELPELPEILSAIKKQVLWRQNANGKFRPEWKHPAAWLHQGCWEDEVEITGNQPKKIYLEDF